MTITLDNDQRVLLVFRKGFSARSYFCNIHHIPQIIKEELAPNDEYTISEYWNYKFTRLSKKRINEMFVANQINFKIS